MLRTAAVAVVLAASAEAFSTPALTGLRMGAENAQINRKQVLQSAGLAAAGVLAAPSLAGAASINKNTGFPEGSCIPNADSAANGCSPMTNTASVLDKQKAVLAGKITVAANKVEALNAAVQAMQGDGKKKKAKFDKEYVLRFSALYFGPLKDSMVAYAERDAAGAKAAGGGGLPKVNKPFKGASSSSLYQYVEAVDSGISALCAAAKKEDAAGVVAAGASIKSAAEGLISQANPPILFN